MLFDRPAWWRTSAPYQIRVNSIDDCILHTIRLLAYRLSRRSSYNIVTQSRGENRRTRTTLLKFRRQINNTERNDAVQKMLSDCSPATVIQFRYFPYPTIFASGNLQKINKRKTQFVRSIKPMRHSIRKVLISQKYTNLAHTHAHTVDFTITGNTILKISSLTSEYRNSAPSVHWIM